MISSSLLHLLAAIAAAYALFKAFFAARVLLSGLRLWWRSVEDRCCVYQSYKVPEFNESFQENPLYRQVSVYVASLSSLEESDFVHVLAGRKRNEFVLHLGPSQAVADSFLGARVSWRSDPGAGPGNCRAFVLSVRRDERRRILRPYLHHIHTVADEIELKKRKIRLFNNADACRDGAARRWRPVPFTHPATIESLAMDPEVKGKVRSDLESFVKARQYYHRLGRVWKRNYLLYGPAGTGKTSFVAGMAKFLGYDVYDVDLSRVDGDSDLKSLLVQTSGRSVIVVEDLDRYLAERSGKVSVTGILNFVDGIISCCGEERIMVFTMSSKEKVDPALLRPGRIDVHIYFPLCDFTAFKTLATTYLGVRDHKLFPHVEEVFQSGATLSPADISEILMLNRSSPSRALKSIISALQSTGSGSAKVGRPLSESGSVRGRGDDSVDGGGAREVSGAHGSRELKKLYGLLRSKSSSGRRKGASFELDEKDALRGRTPLRNSVTVSAPESLLGFGLGL